jgi:hypothetical protein
VQQVCLSYVVLNVALSFDATLFGGFVSSYFSGAPTDDIDLCFPTKTAIYYFKRSVVSIVSMATGYTRERISFRITTRAQYCHKHTMTFEADAARKQPHIVLKIDITSEPQLKRAFGRLNAKQQSPVSIGRFLAYSKLNGFHFNPNARESHIVNISVEDICNRLRNGVDIIHVSPLQAFFKNASEADFLKYLTYFKTRLASLRAQGYTFVHDESYAMRQIEERRKSDTDTSPRAIGL